MYKYKNGNALVSIEEDGTRIIEFEDDLQLAYPLNIDIRVSSKCPFGQREDESPGLCSFCHESAKVNGVECDYNKLKEKLAGLPKGIELAIGCNILSKSLIDFIEWCAKEENDYIVNLTVNQGNIRQYSKKLLEMADNNLIKGLGVSYRQSLKWNVPEEIVNYKNTVFHVIAGIDEIEDILELPNKGVKKILVLGEKDFGFNAGKVDLQTEKHKHWKWYLRRLFDKFEVVSFDNLALEQVEPQRFLSKSTFETFNQGEHSLYINAVDGYYAPSSRSSENVKWDTVLLTDYFKQLEERR
jgi:putative Fe-S oxidoreductase